MIKWKVQIPIMKLDENTDFNDMVLKASQSSDNTGENANQFHIEWSNLPFSAIHDLKTALRNKLLLLESYYSGILLNL